jgi:hypothetical protein
MNTDARIDAALEGLRTTLAADGYLLEWSLEDQNQIGIRVFAGSDACAECLVPPELMRAILSAELSGTPYRVGNITLPATS